MKLKGLSDVSIRRIAQEMDWGGYSEDELNDAYEKEQGYDDTDKALEVLEKVKQVTSGFFEKGYVLIYGEDGEWYLNHTSDPDMFTDLTQEEAIDFAKKYKFLG